MTNTYSVFVTFKDNTSEEFDVPGDTREAAEIEAIERLRIMNVVDHVSTYVITHKVLH